MVQAATLEKEAADDGRRQEQLAREIEEHKRKVEERQKLREVNKTKLAEAKAKRDTLHQERQYAPPHTHHLTARLGSCSRSADPVSCSDRSTG
jgi:septal ring factor EnvC (AmiA/AmiB activator)